jgi:hypothetical protein
MPVTASPFGHELMVLASECWFVKHLACFARDKSGITVDAGYEAAAVSRNGESRIGKELCWDRVSRYLFGALEPDDGWNWNHKSVTQFRFSVVFHISLVLPVAVSDRMHSVCCLSFQLLERHSALCTSAAVVCGQLISKCSHRCGEWEVKFATPCKN